MGIVRLSKLHLAGLPPPDQWRALEKKGEKKKKKGNQKPTGWERLGVYMESGTPASTPGLVWKEENGRRARC